jgi:hypothetical protein
VSQQRLLDVVHSTHDSSDENEDENLSPPAPSSSPVRSTRNGSTTGSRENITDLGEQQLEQSGNMVTQSDISGSDSESLLNTEEMNYVIYNVVKLGLLLLSIMIKYIW